MKIVRLTALALALVLIVALCVPAALAENILPEQDHARVPFDALRQLTFDMEEYDALVQEIEELCRDEKNANAVAEAMERLRDMYRSLETLLAIAESDSYSDVTDAEANNTYAQYLEWYYEMDELMADAVTAVTESRCANSINKDDPLFSMYLEGYEDYTDEELELYYREQELVDLYDERISAGYTTKVKGQEMDEYDLYEAWYYDEISEQQYDDGTLEIAMDKNAAVVDLYLELVENRNRQAKLMGYANAADYLDECTYQRDLTERERENFYTSVQYLIVPLVDQIYNLSTDAWYEMDGDDVGYSGDELLTMLGESLPLVSDELMAAYHYMVDYGYCNIDDADVRADVGYTTILPRANAPYMFLKLSWYDYDYSTIVHEFGHYNAYYCAENTYLTNIDLAEVHSQGLELLMLHNYAAVFDGKADYEELTVIYQLLASLVDGCMYDELERYAYQEKDLTAEKLNGKYAELLKKYGYRDADGSDLAYSWVEIAHLFSSPMYYISYATSAAAAFEIWEASQEDYDGAVDTYLQLVSLGETGQFRETLAAAGLADPLSTESMNRLAETVSSRYGVIADPEAYTAMQIMLEEDSETELRYFGVGLLGIQIALNVLAAIVVCGALVITKGNGRKEHGEINP